MSVEIHYTEDTLVQQTTAEYLEERLGWQSVYAYNNENFGPDSLLGRKDDREVVLTRYLHAALVKLNQGLPEAAYDDAVRQIVNVSAAQSLTATNQEKYEHIKGGVQVISVTKEARECESALEFSTLIFLKKTTSCVCVSYGCGDLYRRRADIVGFINGIPLLFMELKNITKDIRSAYENNQGLFRHCASPVLS